jgi:predicted enzyme related to lactoylglutathione lyase
MKHVDTIILVKDIKASKDYYQGTLGLEILSDWESMIIFKDRFAIHQSSLLQPQANIKSELKKGSQGCGNVVIYFEVDNIKDEYERLLRKGVKIIHGIISLPWQKIFRCKDPDGHIIEIGEKKIDGLQ